MSQARPLPTGTVTFVFTDMVGSTRLLQQLGDRWPGVLREHTELLRTAAEQHHGVELRTDGDALIAAFPDAASGVQAAIAMQRAIGAHQWPDGAQVAVRIAVHTGDVQVAEDDYVGLPLHVTARVRSAAHGGQILVTETTRQLAGEPDTLDLGEHRLRDLPHGVRLHQLVAPGLDRSFPPLASLTTYPNNLPAATDAFVGRRREIAELTKALASHRIVTLTGVGGAGKTRLALRVAADIVAEQRDGAWLVELAPVTDPGGVAAAITTSLRLRDRPGESIRTTLLDWLAHRELLLLLDNCEHLVDAAADLVAAVLAHCPDVSVLATSRELLGVRGELVVPVPPLSAGADPGELGDAVELFIDRATSARPGFDAGSPGVLATVDQLCQRLDGLPLALELAAARLRTMSLSQIVDRLDDRFRLLTSGARTALPRQRTLSAVVAWSHDLLGDGERALFRRVALFGDSFSLAAAESIAEGWPLDRSAVLDLLTQLVDKSLVMGIERHGEVRFQLLETLRQYGQDRLVEAGEVARTEDRLLAWALDLVEGLERDLRTPRQDAALAIAAGEQVNLRTAFAIAKARGLEVEAIRLVSAAPLALPSERESMLRELVAQVTTDLPDPVRASAHFTLSNLALDRGDGEGAVESALIAEEASAADPVRRAWAQYFLLFGRWSAGGIDEARRVRQQCAEAFEALDVPMGRAYTTWVAALLEDDPDRAADLAVAAEAAFRKLGMPSGLAHTLETKGLLALERGAAADAVDDLDEALRTFAAQDNHGCGSHCVETIALHAFAIGASDTAIELARAAAQVRITSGRGYSPWEVHRRQKLWALIQSFGAVDGGDEDRTSDATRFTTAIDLALGHLRRAGAR